DAKEQLKQAVKLIKAGDRATATKVITAAIKADKNNPDAWFLLANVLTEPDKQIKALENALKIDPGYQRARTMLDKLRPPEEAPSAASPLDVADEEYADTSYAFDNNDDDVEDYDMMAAAGVGAAGLASGVFVDDEDDYDAYDDEAVEDYDDYAYGAEEYGLESNAVYDSETGFSPEGLDIDARLQEAVERIQIDDYEGAARLAREVLKENKQDAEAWWVMANAVQDPDMTMKALERVVKLRPDFDEAREWLDELKQENDPETFFARIDDEDDPFGGVDPRADPLRVGKTTREPGGGPPLAFELLTFILMIVVGVGGYFGLRALSGEGTIFAADEAALDASGMGFDADLGGGALSADAIFLDDPQAVCAELPAADREGLDIRAFTVDQVLVRGALAVGDQVDGARQYSAFGDAWTLEVDGPTEITIVVDTVVQGFDPQITVYGPDQLRVEEMDESMSGESERLTLTLAEPGEYVVAVDGVADTCGAYTLSVQ
ncbi:MAG: tetratricopeptide repeat protein, partial [Phototrophicaceae bacterium]